MKQTQTKAGRIESRQYQFNKLIEAGYLQETYKGLDFFTKAEGKYFTLKVFRNTAANHELFMNYHTEVRRDEVIQNYKTNYERNLSYKAEQKEKNKGKSSSHAGAAAAIKKELQTSFPGIKFSVTSDSYSMGDSVHIGWEDGPTTKEVEAISGKYQYGSFNSMEDLYEHTNSRDDIPQTKYVSENRSQSETVKALLPTFAAMFHPDQETDYRNNPESILYRIWSKTSFPAIYENLRIEKTDCTAGHYEEFYCICFDSETTQQTAAPQFKEVETKAGEINIVDYSEKAIAVIGDTKPIKDKLKLLGGSFNPRLSCGAGWIFPKRKLEEITAALTAEPEQNTLQTEIQKTVEFFEETDKKIYGIVQEDTKVIKMLQSPAVKQYDNIQDITEAANSGEVISLLNLCEIVNHK
jgi:hypothetical protein